MRFLILSIVTGLVYLNAHALSAQDFTATDIDVSNDPIVVAAYAKTHSPSGVQFRDKAPLI